MAYVSEYGNYGADGEELLIFKDADLASSQWENLSALPDSDKLPYVQAVLSGADLSDWEEGQDV